MMRKKMHDKSKTDHTISLRVPWKAYPTLKQSVFLYKP